MTRHGTGGYLAAAATALAGCARAPGGVDVVATCATSAWDSPGVVVARTNAEWRALQPRLRGCAASTPPVDFGRRMVIAVPYLDLGGAAGPAAVVDSVVRRAGTTGGYAARAGAKTGCAAAPRPPPLARYAVVLVATPAAGGAVQVVWAPAVAWSECPGV